MTKFIICAVTLILSLTLAGCGDDRPQQIEKYQQLAQQRLTNLTQVLSQNKLQNGYILKQYADNLARQNRELAPLAQQLALDASPTGPLIEALQQRLQQSYDASNFVDLDQQLSEVENIYQAADPAQFNDMLSDPVNVIADMSQGSLARVNAISKQAEQLANSAEDFGAGSQLVGNPTYGQWQTDSGGMSFWAWYGMYSMFSNLFHRPIYYDNWSKRRNYSYYNDVGRYRYTSPKQAKAQNKVYQQTSKTYKNMGKPFASPYAKQRTGSTSLSRQSMSNPKPNATSNSKFRSNYAKESSFRNSSSRTSRGVSRGK